MTTKNLSLCICNPLAYVFGRIFTPDDRDEHGAPGSAALHQLQRPGAGLHLGWGRGALRPRGLRHRV